MSSAVKDAIDMRYPSLADIRVAARRLQGKALVTPAWRWQAGPVTEGFDAGTEIWLKLELFQKTGTFKLRGAVNSVLALDERALHRGVVAASAGNHAIAVAYAAQTVGTHAKVLMSKRADPSRIHACRSFGAELVLTEDIHEAFRLAHEVEVQEGRTMIHAFDGPLIAQGTATIGLEFISQVPRLDAVIVPIGGGGLCAGVAAAIKQINPGCLVYGVEPFGADVMYQSLLADHPGEIESVRSIADSLGAPHALPYSFGVCKRFVDEIVRVNDEALRKAMFYLFRDMKLVTEPATAASTAALLGPLRERLNGKRVGLIVCGANIDPATYAQHVVTGMQLADRHQVSCFA